MSIPRLGNRDLEQFVAILQEDDSGKLTKFSDAVLEMAESVAQSMHRSELLGDRLESWEMEAATAEADCITATNKLDDMPNLKSSAASSRALSEARIKDLNEQR